MPMTFNSLIGPKGTPGSVMGWVNYSKVSTDIETIVAEAESLIYTALRVRQMRSEWVFGMNVGQSSIPLPDRFLDPIGRMFDVTNNTWLGHNIESDISERRSYQPLSGSMGVNPFGTLPTLPYFNVRHTNHGFTQGSTVFYSGATSVDGTDMNTAFPVVQVINDDNYVILGPKDSETIPGFFGGGSSITYTANQLLAGYPSCWTVWDERVMFDTAFDVQATLKQLYYQAPKPLGVNNQSNWLTSRYPLLMRKACQLAVADFMKDDGEYQKNLTAFNALVSTIAMQDDLMYRGSEFGTDTP